MTEPSVPETIFIMTAAAPQTTSDDYSDLEPRRWPFRPQVPSLTPVQITNLHEQVNVFLQQINFVMSKTPEKVGEFQLTEFEISASIVVEAKGSVTLALLANAEAKGGLNAGIKFVFKRS